MGKRFNPYEQVLKTAQQEISNIYTSIPARVIKYYPEKQCVDVRPIIHTIFPEHSYPTKSPTIYDVPVVFPSAGGGILSFPIEEYVAGDPEKTGDIVMLHFSMKGFDEWLVSTKDGDLAQKNRRMHNMTDAVATPCLYQFNDNLSPHPKHVELKFKNTTISIQDDNTDNSNLTITTDGQVGITINVTNGDANINVPSGQVNVDTPQVNMTGNLRVEGDVSIGSDMSTDSKGSYNDHIHDVIVTKGSSAGTYPSEPI